METAGINTSNSIKEGYSRQVANTATTPALSTQTNYSHLGTGVEITSIERMRDLFLDARLNRAMVEQTYWQTMTTGMERVEKFMVNTSLKGLNNLLDSFWTAIQDVHKNDPADPAVRSFFIQEADSLAIFANSLHASYNSYRNELNDDVKALVEEANSLIDQIVILNRSIQTVQLTGAEPNELLDKRDLLASKLCVLTGAEASTSVDEADGDYKITLNGKHLVQGTNTRHLILVENPANNDYYEVQIEYNQYDITSDPDVATVLIERRADDLRALDGSCTTDGTHELEVVRTADELYWTVGYGAGQSEGGDRMDGITDQTVSLGVDGSFSLQVGTNGVRAFSNAYDKNPPGIGIVLGPPGPGEAEKYSFRIAAGSFESTITLEWKNDAWQIADSHGNTGTASGADGELSVSDLGLFMGENYAGDGISVKAEGETLVIESLDRQLLSITDVNGDLMRTSGLANGNPIVRIDVTKDDSLQTIANKINNAYMFDRMEKTEGEGDEMTTTSYLSYVTVPPDTAPDSPDEWMHASVESDGKGGYFLCLTSNLTGEANRINVMSGSICGDDVSDMYVARLLGLVEGDETSYIQLGEEPGEIITRDTLGGDVYVDDAYIRFDGAEFLSSGNEFKDARRVASVGNAPADYLEEFAPGIRATLNGTGTTTILVRHPVTAGEIFSKIKLRDDVLLSHLDVMDDMMYKLATEFNAVHYAGYGTGDYAQVTGMAFFENIKNQYGAFGNLQIDDAVEFDQNRLASASGDGKGHSLGSGDGTNALSIARLKQSKLFMNGTADFDDLYRNFVAEVGAFGARSQTMLKGQDYIVEQVELQRQAVMGVNNDEEWLSIVKLNQDFNYASQYLTTLMQVIDQIISSVGRVGI